MSDKPDRNFRPCVLICMGVSGSGKTTVAKHVQEATGWPFQEGDELHPPANIEKMKQKIPLNDADRAPWLARCKEWIDERVADGNGGLITCSALKRSYRDGLIAGRTGQVRILYLKVSRETLLARVHARQHHFMPPALLDSQLATLEEPGADEHPIVVSVEQPARAVLDDILDALRPPTTG